MRPRRRVVRLLGIDVAVHPGWLLGFLVVTTVLAFFGLPLGEQWPAPVAWAVAGAVAVLFLGSIVAHELTHALTARRLGLETGPLSLFLTPGSSSLRSETQRPAHELAVAASGPLASLAIAGLFAVGAAALDRAVGPEFDAIVNLVLLVAALNVILGALNLVPAFPFDGGRILRAILWGLRGDFLAATRFAANAGRAIGWMAIGGGFLVALRDEPFNGLAVVIVGWFLTRFAGSTYRWAAIQRHLAGVSVGQVMERDQPSVPPGLTLDVFVEQYVATGTGAAFAVATGEELIGTIDVGDARRVPRAAWPTTRVAEAMVPLPDVETAGEDDPLWPAVERFERDRLAVMPVVEGRRLLGVLTRDGLMAAIRGRTRLAER